jgi:ribulose-phosphate 3-epimerase
VSSPPFVSQVAQELPPRAVLASVLAADFSCLGDEVHRLAAAGADGLHFDVMDGHAVPNLSFGFGVIAALRPLTTLPFDIHVMVTNPQDYIEPAVQIAAACLTYHAELAIDHAAMVARIHAAGLRAGLAFNPRTPLDAVPQDVLAQLDQVLIMTVEAGFGGQPFQPLFDKIAAAARARADHQWRYRIVIDGGVGPAQAASLWPLGVDALIAGSSILRAPARDYRTAITALRPVDPRAKS